MECLGYQPNRIARSLRSKSSNSIGLIVSDITNPFFSEIAWSIEYLSYNQNYSVMLCNSDGDAAKEEFYIRRFLEWQVDGIILVSSSIPASHLGTFSNLARPITLVDMECPGYDMDSVTVDNFSGGKQATEHLIALGHKRIACIVGASNTRYDNGRVNGYRAALDAAGLEADEDLIIEADFNIISGMNVAHPLLQMENRPTAIFACGDLMAFGVMQSAFINQLKIPDDLSVVGFDDIYISKYTLPPLTTVRQPIHEMAEEALNCLLEKCDDPSRTTRTIKLDLKLEIRESTAPLNLH